MCRRLVFVLVLIASGRGLAVAQLSFEEEPINYHDTDSNDPIARLQRSLDVGRVTLPFDENYGFLPALLKQLGVSPSSQALVYSKTSFQNSLISPEAPRAIYFGDDIYIGRVVNSDTLEFAAIDGNLGAVFYVLEENPGQRPKFIRDRGQCLICHASRNTQGVPGVLVRSVYPAKSGLPFYGAKTNTTDHTSPFSDQWGGWYVTGNHGSMRHLGNMVFDSREAIDSFAANSDCLPPNANRESLAGRFDIDVHLAPHSDLVALLVLEHQTQMQNTIVRAHYEGLRADHYRDSRHDDVARDRLRDSTARRHAAAAERVVRHLLFVDEFPLTDHVSGTANFATQFEARGPADLKGRSLRQLDLKQRLFKYPCSYMIYSDSFDVMHAGVKQIVYQRLWEVLSGHDRSEDYQHLTDLDRRAIREILERDAAESVRRLEMRDQGEIVWFAASFISQDSAGRGF